MNIRRVLLTLCLIGCAGAAVWGGLLPATPVAALSASSNFKGAAVAALKTSLVSVKPGTTPVRFAGSQAAHNPKHLLSAELAALGQFGGLKSLAKKAVKKAEEGTSQTPPPESQPSQPANSNTTNGSNSSNNAPAASNSGNAALTSSGTSGSAAGTAPGGEPNLVTTKQDFVPGEKTVFFDNFHDMPPGEPPPHWKVRNGTVSLAMGGGIRELRVHKDVALTSATLNVPEDFTFQMIYTEKDEGATDVHFRDKEDDDSFDLDIDPASTGTVSLTGPAGPNGGSLGSGVIKKGECINPCEVDLWAQGGRVRLYFNGKRVGDANEVHYKPVTHLVIRRAWTTVGLRSIRIAKSAPDPGLVLATTGKYVTHGIYFDTDSDVLKPASAGVIKEISTALYKHPDIKLEIDGYTDSSGNAAHNVDLSNRRAEAVMKVLVSQFGIDQSRLSAKGYGDADPIATNNTPEGRAQNRRVEFIKQGAKTSSSGSAGGGAGASADSASKTGGGATASTSATGDSSPYAGLPAGNLVKAKWPNGTNLHLKRAEQIAAIVVFDIGDVEGSCHRHANHYCTIAGLVKGVKTKYWGTLRLTRNPLQDPNYQYKLTIDAHSLNPVHVSAIPRKPGLGGWLSVGRGDFPDMYFNPGGPASTKSEKLGSFSTQVELKHG